MHVCLRGAFQTRRPSVLSIRSPPPLGPAPDASMLQAQELVGTHSMTGIISLSAQGGGGSEQMRKNKKIVIFLPVTYSHQVMPAKGA